MGLDMYLERIDRRALPYKDIDPEDADSDTYAAMKPFLKPRGKFTPWESLFEEVGYWRKANAIHNWFVENVQNGVDDCGRYEVLESHLHELSQLCEKVLTESVMVNGLVVNGYTYTAKGEKPNLEIGRIILNPDVAQKLLPTTDGFFFGSTHYDQYYIDDIGRTYDILQRVLDSTDFLTQAIFYSSSW